MSSCVTAATSGAVLEIVLDRPPVNAITPAVGSELHKIFCEFRDSAELKVAILTANGDRIFCAGWDLKEVAKFSDPGEANDATMNAPGGFAGFTELWDLKKPVIAAVNGFAIGGGFEMVLAADIVVAGDHVEFQLPEMMRGFVPDAGAVQRLPRKVPSNIAIEWMLTGRRFNAHEAERWGLVSVVVPKGEVMAKAREIAATIAQGAPLAIRALMEVVPGIDRMPLPEAFAKLKRGQSDFPYYQKTLASEDFLEGPRAYAEKRKPVWKGR
jgi:crotonobetainyl-CoA hydratase